MLDHVARDPTCFAGFIMSLKSSRKTLAVLEAFSRHGRPMSLGQAAKATGLDKSAVQRCAGTLVALGYLEHDADRRLRISSRCLDLAFNFLRFHPLLPHAYPVLLKLHEETGERTNLSLFERSNLIYAVRIHGNRDFDFLSALIGRRMPVYSTAGGRAMLSKLPDAEVREILKESKLRLRTARTKTSLDDILTQVARARSSGYAVVTGESVTREIALAAAVTDGRGRPIAAIHVASSLEHWTAEDYSRRFAPLVAKAAANLSSASWGSVETDHTLPVL
jgi:DNA-binding IclR family transcriptional regulator